MTTTLAKRLVLRLEIYNVSALPHVVSGARVCRAPEFRMFMGKFFLFWVSSRETGRSRCASGLGTLSEMGPAKGSTGFALPARIDALHPAGELHSFLKFVSVGTQSRHAPGTEKNLGHSRATMA